MTDTADAAQLSLSLSTRDVQFVAAALAVCASLLNPDANFDAEHNEVMLDALFTRYYSATELNELLHRSRALVGDDSPIGFTDMPLMASTTTLVS